MAAALIQHVTDTALWIAGYRAQESERPDAVFKDPLAKKLAGKRGAEIVAATPNTEAMAFAMVTRTTAIDRLVGKCVSLGIDTVINLGAGLDTRPYRLKLPRGLHWIEADFEQMITYKNELLSKDEPVCDLQRIAIDLTDDVARQQLFEKLGARTLKALIITEGVIAYLTNEQAGRLAEDLSAIPTFKYWIQDYRQGKLRNHRLASKLQRMVRNTPFRFDTEDPIGFFARYGWKVSDNIYILDEGERIGRRMPVRFPFNILTRLFHKKMRELGNKTYGYVLFEKQAEAGVEWLYNQQPIHNP